MGVRYGVYFMSSKSAVFLAFVICVLHKCSRLNRPLFYTKKSCGWIYSYSNGSNHIELFSISSIMTLVFANIYIYITIDIPYLSLIGEIWGVFCEFKVWRIFGSYHVCTFTNTTGWTSDCFYEEIQGVDIELIRPAVDYIGLGLLSINIVNFWYNLVIFLHVSNIEFIMVH